MLEESVERNQWRQYKGVMGWVIKAVSALIPLYSIFYIMNFTGFYFQTVFYSVAYLAIFLFLILALVFLLYPATRKSPRNSLPWYDILLIMASAVPTIYQFVIAGDVAWGSKVVASPLDQVLFVVLLVVLAEAVRRTAGVSILIIIVFFIVYAYLAYLLPGLWGSPRYSWKDLTAYMYLFDSGIFGSLLDIGATIIILFSVFGVFLLAAGVGKVIMDSTMAVAGRWRGGPAKVAIIASGFLGTMSGSPIANIATVGPVTIPLMKRLGYRADFAGAVEAVASTGGQLMPPVMGSIAFIMAQLVGVTYGAVCIAAILPALLYYICLYFQLDFEAAKLGLAGLPRHELPSLKKVVGAGWYLLLPIVLLMVLLLMRFDAMKAALYSIGAVIVVSWFRKATRMGFGRIVNALAGGTKSAMVVMPMMATLGIISGSMTVTGLAVNLSALIRDVAGGNIWFLAIFVWVFLYIAGMGVAPQITYLALAIIIAPAFVDLGIPLLVAHMFIFIAGLSMFITPPNCPAVFVACTISGAKMWSTGFQSMKLGIIAFIVPFMILANPALMMRGTVGEIALAFVSSILGAYFWAGGVEGYLIRKASGWQRLFFIAGATCLFIPGWKTDTVGLLLVVVPALTQFMAWRRASRVKMAAS